MRTAVAVFLFAALAGGCASTSSMEEEASREPDAPAASTARTPPAKPPRPRPEQPRLPRLSEDVVALTRGRTTRLVSLEGREVARLRGYRAYTGVRPALTKRSRMWTLRRGRVVAVRERWSLRAPGFGRSCASLARLRGGTVLSCLVPAKGRTLPLLLRMPGGHLRPLVPPPSRKDGGHWRNAFVSPDGRDLLLTWSSECEIPVAFLAAADGGAARPVTGESEWTRAPESVALGWTRDGRALVHLPAGGCANGTSPPGVYAFDRDGRRSLLARLARDGSAAFFRVGG